MPRRRRDTQKVPVIIVSEGGGGSAKKPAKKRGGGGFGVRTRRSKSGRITGLSVNMSFKKVNENWGVQLFASLGEAGAALGATYVDLAVRATQTTADDTVAAWGIPIAGNLVRIAGSRWLMKDHPGAAYILAAMASAFNGASYTRSIERNFFEMKDKVAAKSR
jgi:hypothetical protein